MIKRRTAIAIALAALLLGAGCAWFAARATGDQDLLEMALAYDLESASFCASSLTLVDSQRVDTLVALLEQRLASSVSHSVNLIDDGVRLSSPSPYMTDAARRARDYYAAKNDTGKRQSAEKLYSHLLENQ